MTKEKLAVIRQLASGSVAWPLIVELLEECVKVEERYALRSSADKATECVMRAQGARLLMEMFVAAATETGEGDGGTNANA